MSTIQLFPYEHATFGEKKFKFIAINMKLSGYVEMLEEWTVIYISKCRWDLLNFENWDNFYKTSKLSFLYEIFP